MQNICLKMKLKSETIFGSGESVIGGGHLEIVHDEYGLPFFKGKTLKGKLREEIESIGELVANREAFRREVNVLFGESGDEKEGLLKFSDCKLNKNIKAYILYGLEHNIFTREEVQQSLTQTRKFTSIGKNGIAEKGSLREVRVINPGLELEAEVWTERPLTTVQLGVLAVAAQVLRKVGTLESRGKGQVEMRLYLNDEDVTTHYIDILIGEAQYI